MNRHPGAPRRHTGQPVLLLLLLAALAGALAPLRARAQDTGGVAGLVISTWDGRPLGGVTVVVRGTTLAGQTDAQGRYELRAVPAGDQSLRFSRGGFASTTVTDVRVLPGQVTTVNGNLRPEFFELEEFEVTAEEFNEQTTQILEERNEASGLLDAIGADQFSRVGAGDAADIVAKVPGITISEGKNPVVRGLNERYVGITLNGAEVPSADPYRKSVQLDLFPAGLIDQISISKSFTPDLPGNASGGAINILTRSFPEKFSFNAGAGMEVNLRTTFRDDFSTYPGGGTDWLAMDDGTRALPDELRGVIPGFLTITVRPSQPGFAQQVADARRLQELTALLGPTGFSRTTMTAPPNHNGNFSFGDTTSVLGRRLGFFGGLQYRHNYQIYEGTAARWVVDTSQPGTLIPRRGFSDTRGIQEINWAAIANLAYEVSEDHQLAFNFLFNQNAEDLARQQVGFNNDQSNYFPYVLNRLIWTERNLQTFQLRGGHDFPQLDDFRADWLAAYSTTGQDEPDARFFNYARSGNDAYAEGNFLLTPTQPTRYFRNLAEDNLNLKLDLKKPFRPWGGLEGFVKVGGYSSVSQRDFVDQEIYYQPANAPGGYGPSATYPFGGDPNAFFPEGSFTPRVTTNRTTGRVSYAWHRVIQGRDSVYQADQSLRAGYTLVELPLAERFKLITGFRFESTDLGVVSSGPLASSVTGLRTNASTIQQGDFLPVAGFNLLLQTNMNLRFNFAQTVARPSFRELAAYRQYDPVLDELLEGNPLLVMSAIDNFDLRWEWFPDPGAILSVSFFHKGLANAIERQFITIDGEIISFVNRPSGQVRGFEVEARHGLGFLDESLDAFTLGFNAAYLQSSVALTPAEIANRVQFLGDASASRPLFDQSPYIFNVDAAWDHRPWGTTATLVFNLSGPRIAIAGLATPDVYEQPAPQLDFLVSQRLGEHFKLRLAVRNLLDPRVERTYGRDPGAPRYSSYQRGLGLGLSVGYEF